MKIIKAHSDILVQPDDEDLEQNLYENIELCRVAYKSEDKKTESSAKEFYKKMVALHHMPTLEFGIIHLFFCKKLAFPAKETKYLHTSYFGNLLVTGSVRAFKEFIDNDDSLYSKLVQTYLHNALPNIFTEKSELNVTGNLSNSYFIGTNNIFVKNVAKQYGMPQEMIWKHLHEAVKFTINRVVSHELVRHRPCAVIQESQRYCRYSNNKFGNQVTFIDPRPAFDMFNDDDVFDDWKATMLWTENTYLELLKKGLSPQEARVVLPNSCKTEVIVLTNYEEWKHIFKLRCSNHADPSMREVMRPLSIEMEKRFMFYGDI